MRGLALRAPFLQDFQRVQEDWRLVSDHVNYHVDHLFFFVRYLCEGEGWQVDLVVNLEYVFEGG